MKLTVAEKRWLARLEKTLAAAPASLRKKGLNQTISSFTIGDSDINIYDEEKLKLWQEANPRKAEDDVGVMVDASDSFIMSLEFPFSVESTAG